MGVLVNQWSRAHNIDCDNLGLSLDRDHKLIKDPFQMMLSLKISICSFSES